MGYDIYYRKPSEGDEGYFRFGAFSMGFYVQLMFDLGMAFEDDPWPEFPKLPDGLDFSAVSAVQYPEDNAKDLAALSKEDKAAATAYLAEIDKTLKAHAADTPGIPVHKFSTNDGWIVLPAEAEAAVRAWDGVCEKRGTEAMVAEITERLGGDRAEHWLRWVEYLRGAVQHDGFEVH